MAALICTPSPTSMRRCSKPANKGSAGAVAVIGRSFVCSDVSIVGDPVKQTKHAGAGAEPRLIHGQPTIEPIDAVHPGRMRAVSHRSCARPVAWCTGGASDVRPRSRILDKL